MKRPLLLLILFFLSAQSFADDCPDGSELVRSISADGTYYLYNCNVIDLTKISTDTIAEAQPNTVAPGYMTNELTTKNWLSAFQLKPKDLSPMIIELAKKTQLSVPECSVDFCFTSQAEYASNDEIQNKGELINAVLRDSPAFGVYSGGANSNPRIRAGKEYFFEVRGEIKDNQWKVMKLFPLVALSLDGSPYEGPVDYWTEDEFLAMRGIRSDEQLLDLLKSERIPVNVEYGLTDEITNTDQLIQSLLFWNPNAFDSNMTHKWEGPDRITVTGYVENVHSKYPWTHPECFGTPEEWDISCTEELFENPNPPTTQPPLEPISSQPIKLGWKIQEGSNFWSVDEDDPYWQTEEGSKELDTAKKRGSWIEGEASRYAKENPGVDPPIASYYATDGCGEGKQPANASC